jgi:hypothetical protein
MAANIPTLRGMSPWILKDFQSPRREHPVFQNGWNRKGLVSETGVRHQAYGVLAADYRGKAATAPSSPSPCHGGRPHDTGSALDPCCAAIPGDMLRCFLLMS